MRVLVTVIVCLFSLRCFAEKGFVQKDIGVSFKYDENMLFDFNPHSMRKTKVYFNDEHIGGFVVSSLPEDLTLSAFLGAGEEWYQGKYPGAQLTIKKETNESKNDYYRVSAEVDIDGHSRLEEKFIFVVQRDIGLDRKAFITYTFTYLYPLENQDIAKDKLYKPVSTFKYLENRAYFNAAIKRASAPQP